METQDLFRRATNLGFRLQKIGLIVSLKTSDTGSYYLMVVGKTFDAIVRFSDHKGREFWGGAQGKFRFDIFEGWTEDGVYESLVALI